MPIRKSRVSGITASGTTADRPSNPSIGDTFFNGTLGVQEIYTSSGWLPATGANDFNIVLTGSETSVTLDKEYFSGAYTITSALSDTTFDVYLFDTSNNAAGYSNTPSINATSNFNKIIIYGGTNGDLLSFSYKTTFTTSATTTDTFAAPYITSVSVADLPNIDDTTTITGGNFDTDIQVWFDGANSYSQQAKSVVYGSSTSIVATRPDDLLEDNAPYTIRLINPNTTSPAGSNRHTLVDSITAGGDPAWTTAAGALTAAAADIPYSVTLQATDPDSGTITYTIVSGQLPTGLSLNGSTGVISGTPTGVAQSFTVAATDPGGNVTNRSFSIGVYFASGGTVTEVGGYTIHTFTENDNFIVSAESLNVEYLLVAGGGAGGDFFDGGGYNAAGGGGGAGGVLTGTTTLSANAYEITVGLGGVSTATSNSSGGYSTNGGSSSAFGLTAVGGGRGGAGNSAIAGAYVASSGGSGGGGVRPDGGAQFATAGTGTNGQGSNGGNYSSTNNDGMAGGGGGAGGAGQIGGQGSNGGAGIVSSITGTAVTYAGGGGGGRGNTGTWTGAGGAGGGGQGGSKTANSPGGNATGYGSGGGGAGSSPNTGYFFKGGNGSSGIVIIRYSI